MRLVLKHVRQRTMSKHVDDTDSSQERAHYSSDLASLLDRIDKLIGSSRIPTDPIKIQ
jgi:hypothetical protein